MEWYEPLYVSDSMQKKVKRIKWRLEHNAGVLNGFVITFSTNPENLLDVYPMKLLKFNSYLRKNLKIIGIAKDHEEAMLMVTEIINETYQNTQSTNVWEYFNEERGKK